MRQELSYSVINTHKAMLFQTLPFFGVKWTANSVLIPKLLKGYFNCKPVRPKIPFTWDVSVVLTFLSTLYPLSKLSLKLLTYKLIALVALTTASRAQTISALDIRFISKFYDKYVFQINQLLKTSKPGVAIPNITLYKLDREDLCVVKTLEHYLERTKNIRKSTKLFISFKTFNSVTTCTLARWLKEVLHLSGINISNFTAHSYRSASTSKAIGAGFSLKEILKTANWTSAKTFYRFYNKDIVPLENFSSAIIQL